MDKVRLDKWLWAARFFKTRSLAKAAIEGGKVKVEGQRTKPSREITTGLTLTIRQGWDDKTVIISALSDQRRGAAEANTLYQETAESIATRETAIQARKLGKESTPHPQQRPDKKQRRMIHRFKEENNPW